MTGKAYLVGAGPGRADLITVRGLRLLHGADVVLYDRLIARELLDEAPPGAEMVFVGKREGHHLMPQEEINQLIASRVCEGKQVVRLKGGDPFVFGRGGEEALLLAQQGVPFEVVPGVTSAIAALTYAGIPITHRGLSTGFVVVTGHEAPDKPASATDWEAVARLPTIVILMAVARMGAIADTLITAGRSPDTPAAAISWATTDCQRVVPGTLSTIADEVAAAELETPAVFVIGEVAGLAEQLDWYEPDGCAEGFIPLLDDLTISAMDKREKTV
jgi:uroporphyrin-III C-methyltransferase